MSESRADRQKALEERRRRISELRESRTRRSEDTARIQASTTANLDDFVTELLNEPVVEVKEEEEQLEEEDAQGTATTQVQQQPAVVAPSSTRSVPVAVAPPPAVETFTVSTQTEPDDFVAPEELEEEEDPEEAVAEEEKKEEGTTALTLLESPPDTAIPKHLTPSELKAEVASTNFNTFINTASKKVERMLGASTTDWMLDPMMEERNSSLTSEAEQHGTDAAKFVSEVKIYECPKWTHGRDITDIDWSPLHRELVLTCYQQPAGNNPSTLLRHSSAPSDSLTPRSGELQSDGLVAIWSLVLPNRPEHLLTTGSPVTCGKFHPTDAHLVVGGCRSGQVVVWDVRAGRLPVQKSTAVVGSSAGAKMGHTHAVNAMRVLDAGVRAF
jgi:dynein intermediate chain